MPAASVIDGSREAVLFFATFAVLPFTNFITSAAPRLAVGLNTPAAFVVVDEKLLDRPSGCLFRICWLPLSVSGGEFEASRPVTRPPHFVLQFVEQPAELRRVLLGAREFDRPIVRARRG